MEVFRFQGNREESLDVVSNVTQSIIQHKLTGGSLPHRTAEQERMSFELRIRKNISKYGKGLSWELMNDILRSVCRSVVFYLSARLRVMKTCVPGARKHMQLP